MADIDIFSPFRVRSEEHEDRLTWGFMVALKYVPELQRFLRELVLQQLPAGRWPVRFSWDPAVITTQTDQIGAGASIIVSVLLSDASLGDSVEVERSERRARYDAVVEYPDGLVLIIENKKWSGSVWTGQLSPSLASFEGLADDVDLFERVVSIEWADVLEGVLNFSASKFASYTEKSVAGDFLSFVEGLHPTLSPYRTFKLCGTRQALAKRIEGLLNSTARGLGYEVRKRPGNMRYIHVPSEVVQQVHLNPDDEGQLIRLGIWPGDTVQQARALLDRIDHEAFLALPAKGWQVRTNLHFSFMQRHLVWAHVSMGVSDYFAYFASNPKEIGQRRFADISLGDLSRRWTELGLITESDVEYLNKEFRETRRSSLNVIPGFELTREWTIAEIHELEGERQLEKEIVSELGAPFSTWGESLPMWVLRD